jgi:methionyl-tRNA formyltransferase
LTIFWPDGGIDTGPILLQKEVEISPDDTTGSLYFGKLFPLGVQAILEAVELVDTGVAPRLPQEEQLATYEPLCTAARCVIDWTRPRQDVYNLIRGANPQPGANSTFRGTPIYFFDVALWNAAIPAGNSGEIRQVLADGIVVQTGDRPLLVKRVQPYGGVKSAASEWAANNHIQAGDRFG